MLDFYCHECKLAIELDDSIHSEKEIQQFDSARTKFLSENVVTVIRFRNEEVINDVTKVIMKIADWLTPT